MCINLLSYRLLPTLNLYLPSIICPLLHFPCVLTLSHAESSRILGFFFFQLRLRVLAFKFGFRAVLPFCTPLTSISPFPLRSPDYSAPVRIFCFPRAWYIPWLVPTMSMVRSINLPVSPCIQREIPRISRFGFCSMSRSLTLSRLKRFILVPNFPLRLCDPLQYNSTDYLFKVVLIGDAGVG